MVVSFGYTHNNISYPNTMSITGGIKKFDIVVTTIIKLKTPLFLFNFITILNIYVIDNAINLTLGILIAYQGYGNAYCIWEYCKTKNLS